MSETIPKEAVEQAADAIEAQAIAETNEAVAVAGAAEAVTKEAISEAAATTVAAATGAAALAEVSAAKAKVEAANEIKQVKGGMAWLDSNAQAMGNSLAQVQSELTETKQTQTKIMEGMAGIAAALDKLIRPNSTPESTPNPPHDPKADDLKEAKIAKKEKQRIKRRWLE